MERSEGSSIEHDNSDVISRASEQVFVARHEIDAMFDRAQVRIGKDSALQQKLGKLHNEYAVRFQALARNITRLATTTMLLGVVACSPREGGESSKPEPAAAVTQEPSSVAEIPAEHTATTPSIDKKQEVADVFSAFRLLMKKHRPIHKADITKYLKFGTREHSFVEVATRDGGIKFLFDDQKGSMHEVDNMPAVQLAKFIPKESTMRVTLLHTHPLDDFFVAGFPAIAIERMKQHPETSLPVPPSDMDFNAHLYDITKFNDVLPNVRLESGVFDRSGVVWRMYINPDSPLLKPGMIKEYMRVHKLREATMTKQEKQMLDTIHKLEETDGGLAAIEKIRDSEQYRRWRTRMEALETPDYLFVRGFVGSANSNRFDIWLGWQKDGYIQGERTKKAIEDFIKAMKDTYKVDLTCTPRE